MHTESNMTNSWSASLRKQHLGGKLNCVVMPDVTALVSILFILPNVSTYCNFTSKFSSKYSTYSFQDNGTKEIVHFELVEVIQRDLCLNEMPHL